MAKTFVAIQDPVHKLLRCLTRKVPLAVATAADGAPVVEYQVRGVELPQAYYSLAVFHALEGWPLEAVRWEQRRVPAEWQPWVPPRANYFDALTLDRRCRRDLRLRLHKHGPGLLAAELLSFGTGLLRARNDNPLDASHRALWRRYGRLQPQKEEVYATLRALPWNALPLLPDAGKEHFDSTNVLTGDVLGELEQLWERRADLSFLDLVAQSLQRMRRQGQVAVSFCPPAQAGQLLQLHLRAQRLWKIPPTTGRVLLRRVEWLLGHTILDVSTPTLFRGRAVPLGQAASSEWHPDPSGYDGWLSGSAAGPVDLI